MDQQATALNRLEHHFRDRLLVDTGNVTIVGEHAEQLRLQITEDERAIVLDYIAQQKMVAVTMDKGQVLRDVPPGFLGFRLTG